MATLKDFKNAATAEEVAELVKLVGTSEGYLFSHLGKHRPYSAEKAAAVELATAYIALLNDNRTPVVSRTSLCTLCATCVHACASRVEAA